ncbi:chloride channel protein [Leucobacter sp. cx-42]|uniref:chloride channel protein n=1 Tax=unclassified Leucobacter TaxID=2621730 RepID=UPI00165E8CCF|nr:MULTISPECIES: chloride channel protein [unclassified Leucobacter]MBC9955322.1 chloride channel protein [Leucobacter sp. cx-42]
MTAATPQPKPTVWTRLRARVRPVVTAVGMGGFAGLITILTFQGMMWLQHVIWGTAPVGPLRIVLTILAGGALLLVLARFSPTETVDELIRDTRHPWLQSRRTITVTALVAIVSVAFGGAIGPEAGLLAVVAQCSSIVSRLIARDEAQVRAISEASAAGSLGGLYGSPPAAAALEGDLLTPSKLSAFIAGVSGFFVFIFVARNVFGGEGVTRVPLPEATDGVGWLILVPVLVGAVFGAAFRVLHSRLEAFTSAVRRPWLLTVVGTLLFAGLAALLPLVRFSGHHDLGVVNELFAEGEGGFLWVIALAKLAALLICLGAGWRGGEIFPLIFIGAAAGAACAVLLPEADPAAAVLAAMAATVTVGWRKPLAAFLLLILVVENVTVLPLLAGVGGGLIVDRLFFNSATSTEPEADMVAAQ